MSNLAPPIPLHSIHRFTVEEYHRMGEVGILERDIRIELLDGWIIDRERISPHHRYSVEQIYDITPPRLPSGWSILLQWPLSLITSEPLPDLVVVRGTYYDYRSRFPGPADVGLVIEVLDSTSPIEHHLKRPIYAAAGIPCYWIVDLVHRQVECHSLPISAAGGKPATYDRHDIVDATGSLSLVLDGSQVATIKVADVLP